jgi:hypothetical protein
MSTSASLDPASVTVEPGGAATTTLQVHNSGPTVESYRFEAVGEDAPWMSVQPAGLTLYPGTSEAVTVQFRPPHGPAALAGDRAFGVRVVPTDRPDQVVVPEGVLSVLPFVELTGELTPQASTGAVRGRHRVALDNLGNAPVAVRLTAQPAGERIRLDIEPEDLVLPPGQAAFVRVDARARKRLWRGAPATHPFQVGATAETGQSVILDGSYQQQPLLPRWLPRVVTFAALALVALLALWFALVKPAVRSAAREVVAPEVAKVLAAPGARPGQPGGPQPSGGTPSTGTSASPSASPSAGQKTTTSTAAPRPATPAKVSTSARLEVRDAVGGSAHSAVYQVPDRQILDVTDIVVQNPQGDAGTLTVSSQGRTLLILALENFRDDDYHFVTPVVVPAKGTLTMTVTCRQVGAPIAAPTPASCVESLLLSGSLRPAPRPATLR